MVFSLLDKPSFPRQDAAADLWALRIGLISAILIYLAFGQTDVLALVVPKIVVSLALLATATGFLVRAMFWSTSSKISPLPSVAFDALAITSGLYFGGESTSALYGLYCLSALVHAYRYGINTMLASAGCGALGFTFVISQQPYWHANFVLSLGLLATLLILPLPLAWTVNRLIKVGITGAELGTPAPVDNPSQNLKMLFLMRGIVNMIQQLRSSPISPEQSSDALAIGAAAANMISTIDETSAALIPESTEFNVHRLLRSTIGLMSDTEVSAGEKRVIYQIGSAVPFRLHGNAFAFQQILIDLINELLDSSTVNCVEISVDLAQRPAAPPSSLVWLSIDISAIAKAELRAESSASKSPSSAHAADSDNQLNSERFATDVAPRLIASLGGDLASSMDSQSHTCYAIQLPFAHSSTADARPQRTQTQALQQSRAMVIGGDLSGRAQAYNLLVGWGADVTQHDSITQAFTDLIQNANRAADYDLIVVDSRGLNVDANAIAQFVKQEPLLNAIPLVLITQQQVPAGWKTEALRAGYGIVLSTPLDKTLLFNALHAIERDHTQRDDDVLHLIDHYRASNRVSTPLDILVSATHVAERSEFKAVLEQIGHRVYATENGAQALEALNNRHFDLAFLDVHMLEMGGVEALRRYRQTRNNTDTYHQPTPVILLIADGDNDARGECLRAGAYDVLTKPVRKQQLLAAVGRIRAGFTAASPSYERTQDRPRDTEPQSRLSGVPILDRETLNDLELLGSGIGFVADLVANFLQDGEYLLERLTAAQRNADTHVFRDVAHALKGSAGSVGAKELFKLAGEAGALRGKRFEQSSARLVTDLKAAFQATRLALLAYINERRSQNSLYPID